MKKMIIILLLLLAITGCTVKQEEKTKLNPDNVLKLTSKDELAAFLNCEVDDIRLLVEYAEIMERYLRYPVQSDETQYERGVTDCDERWISAAELRSLTDRVILTKDNWMDYFGPKTYQTEFCDYNYETGESNCEWGDAYDIGWLNDFYADDNTVLILKNKDSNEEIIFDGCWPEYVSYEDGKYLVETYDKDGNWVSKEFKYENYECLEAHGILFKDNVPEEMIYNGNNSMSGDPFFDYQYIYIKYDDGSIYQEWLPGAGKLVFEK